MNTNSLITRLENAGYYANKKIAEALNAAMTLKKPLLIEGAPGVGKTSLASALASAMKYDFIRLQMYEGLTDDKILYDYDYTKQLLSLEAVKKIVEKKYNGYSANKALGAVASEIDFYQPEFLIERPVLKSISGKNRCVLLIDEIDKAPEELEYMFYEFFENYSISIPQYGTITCDENMTPIVILTSNGYRELSQALKRRCAYLYIPAKTTSEMAEIIKNKAQVSPEFAQSVASWLTRFGKEQDVMQKPSIAEGIDWAKYLYMIKERDQETIVNSLGILFKNEADLALASKSIASNPSALKGIVTIER